MVSMLNGKRTTPPPASSEVELESLPPLVDSPASPDPQTPADDDTNDDEYVDYCPYPETPSATASLPEQSALPKASGSMTGPKSPTPPTASWSWSSSSCDGDDKDYRGVVDECSEAVVRHVRRAMNTCCMTHVAHEVRGCFGRANARGHGACVFGRYS